jgi:hypothetical protein
MTSSAADLPRGAGRPIPSRQPQVLRKPSPNHSPRASPGPQRHVLASAPLKDARSAASHNPDDEWRDVRIKCQVSTLDHVVSLNTVNAVVGFDSILGRLRLELGV